MSIQVSSTAFPSNADIPAKYSCSGDDVQPALSWSGVPSNAQSLALIVEDPDAPGGTFTHWVAYDLPAKTSGIGEGAALPPGASAGRNDFRTSGYRGPCPPPGQPHHYHFRIFALDQPLGLKAGATRDDVLDAMKGHVLDQGELVGTFGR